MESFPHESISVIVITRNRYKMLKECIESLLNQTVSADEIIIVDDFSNDLTSQIANEYPAIKYIRAPRRLGVAGARNLGILIATSDWVAFIDDDAVADTRWLESFKRHLRSDVVGIRGCVIPKSGRINILAKHYDIGQMTCEVPSLLGCNMIINRTALKKAGLFDEQLVAYHDEYDLSLRLSKLGKLLYCPHAIISHEYARSLKGFLYKKFSGGLWKVYVNFKNGESPVGNKRIPFVTLFPTCVMLTFLSLFYQPILSLLIIYVSTLLIARHIVVYLRARSLHLALIGTIGELIRDLGVLVGIFKFGVKPCFRSMTIVR